MVGGGAVYRVLSFLPLISLYARLTWLLLFVLAHFSQIPQIIKVMACVHGYSYMKVYNNIIIIDGDYNIVFCTLQQHMTT